MKTVYEKHAEAVVHVRGVAHVKPLDGVWALPFPYVASLQLMELPTSLLRD